MNPKRIAYFQLHFAVILYGLTAILGDLISISALNLVWWRVFITSFSLLFFIQFGKQIIAMPRKLILIYAGIGVLVAIHWITFYGAIKLSNASIVLAAMATTSFFTSIIEPLITKKKFQWLEFILGFLVIPPMILIAQNIDLSTIFSSLNKKWVNEASPYQISFIEMFSAFIFISFLLPFVLKGSSELMPTSSDWVYIIILSLFCTTLAYVISMKALKHVSAFDATLVINMEPVYGILLAIVILKEHKEMSPLFYFGVLLIMLVVFSHPILKKLLNAKQ